VVLHRHHRRSDLAAAVDVLMRRFGVDQAHAYRLLTTIPDRSGVPVPVVVRRVLATATTAQALGA
jgi:hypothetical protein